MLSPSEIEKEYEDWVALLKARKAEDLLEDPINVWIEAWTIATIRTEMNQPRSENLNH
jgi:hypothetical protein